MNNDTHPSTRTLWCGPSRREGSALVLTLMIVSLMMILVLAFAARVRMESREIAARQNRMQAQNNARLGTELAIAQLQLHAGPDQRITAPATTVFPSKDFTSMTGELYTLYRNRAESSGGVLGPRRTYMTRAGRTAWENDLRIWWNQGERHPHWVAALDSSLRAGGGPSTLYGEPERNQTPVWLVSGNETLPQFTPLSPLPADAVQLVGPGSAASAAASVDGLTGYVRAPRVGIQGAAPNTRAGSYAFWVGDESTKANFSVRDPWFAESNIRSPTYRNRLQVPQRIGWERINGLAQVFDNPANNLDLNDPLFDRVNSSKQIALLSNQFPPRLRENYHHLTAFSRSLFTDTLLGGLRKDLTVFFEGAGSGIAPAAPVADRSLYPPDDPRFGGASNDGFPRTAATEGLPTWGRLKDWYDNNQSNLGPVLAHFQIFTAFTHKNGEVQYHVLPLVFLWNPHDVPLTSATYQLDMRHNIGYWGFGLGVQNAAYADPVPDATTAGYADGHKVGEYYLPPLRGEGWFDSATGTFKRSGIDFRTLNLWTTGNSASQQPSRPGPNYRFKPFDVGTTTDGAALPTSPDATWVPYRITDSFAPGEVKVFSVMNAQQVDPRALHTGSAFVTLENGYDPDFPESYWFTIASGLHRQPGTPAAATDTVRWIGHKLLGNSPNTISVRLRRGGGTLWELLYTGSQDNISWQRSNPLFDPDGNNSDDPRTWKRVYHLDDWPAVSKNFSDQRLRESPVQALAGNRLDPFMPQGWQLYSNGIRQGGMTQYQRFFATGNLSAAVMDPVPEIDLARAAIGNNNQDGFQTMRLWVSHRGNGPHNWVSDQVDDDRGFALFGWQNLNPTLNTRGMSGLITRQARANYQLLSLGQLQQANLARYSWQPGFTIGNSEASPYVDRDRAAGLQSYSVKNATATIHMMLNLNLRLPNTPMTFPNDNRNRFLDLSFVMNEALWDRYFLSSIPQSGALNVDQDLPNSRVRFRAGAAAFPSELRDTDLAAAHLENIGALNVNSTSTEAWKALLTAFRGLAIEGDNVRNPANTTPISRNMVPLQGPIDFTDSTRSPGDYGANPSGSRRYDKLFQGFRYLTDAQIQTLAERIVDEVRLRGPFYSVSDFVNRRLIAPDRSGNDWLTARTQNLDPSAAAGGDFNMTHAIGSGYDPFAGLFGLNGALQRAINLSGINGGMNYAFADDEEDRVFRVDGAPGDGIQGHPMNKYPIGGSYLDSEHLSGVPAGEVGQLLSHSPGFVTQADLLAMIGPALAARGDTFVIRSYGDHSGPDGGNIQARAYLEVVVQRVPEPVTPSGNSGAARFQPSDRWGRRFVIISRKWLVPDEI